MEDEAIQQVKDMITEHAGVTEFEEDDNDSISLLGDDEGLDLAWSLADAEEPVDGMYLSDEADQVSLEIGDLPRRWHSRLGLVAIHLGWPLMA